MLKNFELYPYRSYVSIFGTILLICLQNVKISTLAVLVLIDEIISSHIRIDGTLPTVVVRVVSLVF